MKIWLAKLKLFTNDEDKYETRFTFDMQDEDYEISASSGDKWIYSRGYISDVIPMNMIISNSYLCLQVLQGFDHKLTEEESINLEDKMREVMIKHLTEQRQIFEREHDEKLKVIYMDMNEVLCKNCEYLKKGHHPENRRYKCSKYNWGIILKNIEDLDKLKCTKSNKEINEKIIF